MHFIAELMMWIPREEYSCLTDIWERGYYIWCIYVHYIYKVVGCISKSLKGGSIPLLCTDVLGMYVCIWLVGWLVDGLCNEAMGLLSKTDLNGLKYVLKLCTLF